MRRIKLGMFKRNALIAAGNLLGREARPELLARIIAIAADTSEPDLVRRTARDVLRRLDRR